MAVDATQSLDWVEEPGFTADGEVETGVAIGDDVQTRRLLRVDHGGDGVDVLFAKQRVAHRGLERFSTQADVVPERPGI